MTIQAKISPSGARGISPSPSAVSIAAIREFDAKTVELIDYVRRPDIAAQRRSCYRIEPPLPVRHATEAEIMEEAAALDRGEFLNPRLWMERMTIRGAA